MCTQFNKKLCHFVGSVIIYNCFYFYIGSNNWWNRISLYKRNSENGDIIISIGKHELYTSYNLFAVKRYFSQDKSVALCCVIVIHDMNTYKTWRFCRPSNVPGSISLMLLLDRYLRWENKVGLKHLITKPVHLVIFTNVLRFSFSRSNTLINYSTNI